MNCKSVAADEVAKFARLQRSWWDPAGPLKTLHDLNPVRVKFISDTVAGYTRRSSEAAAANPLAALRVLDVGCGGGVLSEALARRGANVLGIDVCAESVAVAQRRCEQQPNRLAAGGSLALQFACRSVLDVDPEKESFDVVVASEVLEHVEEPAAFVARLCELVAVDGCLVITTLNKTLLSGALYIGVAEGLGLVPQGTHDWAKFVPPADLSRVALQHHVQCVNVAGVRPVLDLAATVWSGAPSTTFKLSSSCTSGHYFWSGVKLPR